MTLLLCAQPASLGTPADCCPVPSCSLEFQTKSAGGGATLCGISEYASPSSPPKKYRRQDIDGEWCNNDRPASCGGAINNHDRQTYTGHYLYSSTTCGTTNNQSSEYGLAASNNDCASVTMAAAAAPGVPFAPSFLPAGHYTLTEDAQTRTWEYDNACYDAGGFWRQTRGTITATLNQEDSEDDAISRADAGESWSSCSSGCTGYKALRGAGVFNMAYRTLQVRYQAGAGVDGATYNVALTLARRLQGTADAFVDFAELTHQHIGTGSAYTGPWLSVPTTSGYEVQVSACAVTHG